MNKLTQQTVDVTQENVKKLQTQFPECITEAQDPETGLIKTVVDFERLRTELGDDVAEPETERYQLTWPGKRSTQAQVAQRSTMTLRPDRGESIDFDNTQNIFVEGDNLEALRLLQRSYWERIKLIYIDPPYNTGSDLIYHDDYRTDQEEHELKTGERDEAGGRLVSNPETNGRFHSDWLTMITPRLRLAKNLLTRDGAIFVSIDENEHPRLRLVMDEIFGQSNFVADIVWSAGRKNNSRLISNSHQYIICYCRDKGLLAETEALWRQQKRGLAEIDKEVTRLRRCHGTDYSAISNDLKSWYNGLPKGDPSKAHHRYCRVDPRGIYYYGNISVKNGPRYDIFHPQTGLPVKAPKRGWVTDEPGMHQLIQEDRIVFGDSEATVPKIKTYLHETTRETPYSVFYTDGRGATKRLEKLLGGRAFDNPKDEFEIQRLIEMTTSGEDIILDFFAGSSTTAHAVLLQNAADGGNRRFIMVQLPEYIEDTTPTGKTALALGYANIAELSRDRIRRAGAEIISGAHADNWNQDVGFRALRVDTSNFDEGVTALPSDVEQTRLLEHADHIKADRTEEDLLLQVILNLGLDLSAAIATTEIDDYLIYHLPDVEVVACFGDEITSELVKQMLDPPPQNWYSETRASLRTRSLPTFQSWSSRWHQPSILSSSRHARCRFATRPSSFRSMPLTQSWTVSRTNPMPHRRHSRKVTQLRTNWHWSTAHMPTPQSS